MNRRATAVSEACHGRSEHRPFEASDLIPSALSVTSRLFHFRFAQIRPQFFRRPGISKRVETDRVTAVRSVARSLRAAFESKLQRQAAYNLRLVSPENTQPRRLFLVRAAALAIRSTESVGARYY